MGTHLCVASFSLTSGNSCGHHAAARSICVSNMKELLWAIYTCGSSFNFINYLNLLMSHLWWPHELKCLPAGKQFLQWNTVTMIKIHTATLFSDYFLHSCVDLTVYSLMNVIFQNKSYTFLKRSFTVTSLRQTCCVISILLWHTHTPVRWTDGGETLVNTDVNTFVKNIWEKWFILPSKVWDLQFFTHEKRERKKKVSRGVCVCWEYFK